MLRYKLLTYFIYFKEKAKGNPWESMTNILVLLLKAFSALGRAQWNALLLLPVKM